MLKDIKTGEATNLRGKRVTSRNREKSTSELKVTTFLQYGFFDYILRS